MGRFFSSRVVGEGNPVGGNVTSNVSGQDVFYQEWMVSLVIPLSLYHTPDVLVADSANVTRRIIDDVDVRLFGRLLLEDLYRRGPCQQHYRRLAVRAVSL